MLPTEQMSHRNRRECNSWRGRDRGQCLSGFVKRKHSCTTSAQRLYKQHNCHLPKKCCWADVVSHDIASGENPELVSFLGLLQKQHYAIADGIPYIPIPGLLLVTMPGTLTDIVKISQYYKFHSLNISLC